MDIQAFEAPVFPGCLKVVFLFHPCHALDERLNGRNTIQPGFATRGGLHGSEIQGLFTTERHYGPLRLQRRIEHASPDASLMRRFSIASIQKI